jgi:ubiquinone/menaquinone biosynthesis C-methylase UbiE
MERAEFDRFADEYEAQHACNIRISGETPEFFARYKVEDVAAAVGSNSPRRILDFGGGIGTSVPHFHRVFPSARLTCLDVSPRSVEIARQRHGDAADFELFDGTRIPHAAETFDIAYAACVFHHIDAAEHVSLLSELRRVLAPGGSLFVFEHNPLNPVTRHAVDTCPFDENAVLIAAPTMRARVQQAGFERVDLAYRIFFPGALRFLRPAEKWLTRVPLGAQYYVRGMA